jgi:hypothetical protein
LLVVCARICARELFVSRLVGLVGCVRLVVGTFAEVLAPDDPFLKRGQEKGFTAGFVLADVLRQTGGAYQTSAPMSEKFRVCIRAVARRTSDDELLHIADLPDVPVSLENCRELDPQTHFVMICRLDVSPTETPRWRRIQPDGISAWPRDMCGMNPDTAIHALAPCLLRDGGPPPATRTGSVRARRLCQVAAPAAT